MTRRDEESRGFIEAIRDAPEDDTHRLVYADWLEDHDDPARAEFIRIQCELARPTEKGRRAGLEARERELLVANRRPWLGPLGELLRYDHCTFRRGFPEDLTVRPSMMVELAEALDARVPAARVSLYGGFGDPAMKALAACPTLDWVAALKYEHPRVSEAGLTMIAESPHLKRLTELSIRYGDITSAGLLALTTSPHRAALRSLNLHHSNWNGAAPPETAAAIAADGVRMRLRSLVLYGHGLGAKGAATLAGSPHLVELKELNLLVNGLGDEGAAALTRSPFLKGLTDLNLQTNGLTGRSARELVASPLIDGIRYLNLGVNDIGDDGAEALAGSMRLRSLERLSLWSTKLTDRGAAALAASPHLSRLTELQLGNNSLTPRGSQLLFDSPYLQRLERISLSLQSEETAAVRAEKKRWQDRLGKEAKVH